MSAIQISPDAHVAKRYDDFVRSLDLVRLPASQVSFVLHGCLDSLPMDLSEKIRQKMEDRDFSIRLHRVAKEVIILHALREMLEDPAEIGEYVSLLNSSAIDPHEVAARQGMLSMLVH